METKEFGCVPRFSGQASEFSTWKFLMMAQLRARDMDQLVKESEEAVNQDKDKKAFALLLSAMPTEVAGGLIGCECARDVWKKLIAIYEYQSSVSRTLLLQKFYALNYTPGDTMAVYLAKVEGLVSQLKSAGVKLEEIEVVIKILGTLPPEYGALLSAWDESQKQSIPWLN